MQGALLIFKPIRPLTAGRIKHLARQAELESKTGATGLTLLRAQSGWSTSPIARLVESGKIGPDELRAANEMSTAFISMAGALMVRAQTWERIDKGQDSHEPAAIVDAQRQYRIFAAHWSIRRGWGDRTLEIMIETVVHDRPFYLVDEELNLRNGKGRQATIRGLRDYAVRAGWVGGRIGQQWTAAASNTFRRPVNPELARAIARARVVTSI